MEFKKYNSIENSYREKEIEKIREAINRTEMFVVSEKIDGCNLSLISNGSDVQVAKRSCVMNGEAKIYNSDIILEKYKNNVLEMANYFKEYYNAKQIQIFGEHFGGMFEGKTEKGYAKIQNRVEYIPFTDFIVFDILVTFMENNEEKTTFLNWNKINCVCKHYGFKVAPELFKGTFEECLEYPNTFNSKIPEIYGLKSPEKNIAEGVVIKPIVDLRLRNGSRIILKNKNDKFKEKGKSKIQKIKVQLNDTEKEFLNELTKYFEVSRIQSVLSKGDVKLDWKQFGKLSGLFFKDALEDFIKDNEKFTELDKDIQKAIKKEAQNVANDFIRDFMKKHI